MAKAAAEWTGVISIGPFILDCRLFSAFGKAKPFPLRYVHTNCHTVLEEVEEKEARESPVEEVVAKLPAVQVREQFFCPKCQRPLRTDEIGRGLETEAGIIEVSEAEIASLEFEPTKQLKTELIQADDPAIEAVGFGRRLYVVPKPAATGVYSAVFYMLRESRRIAFISPLIIKRKTYITVLRPLEIPEVIFGKKRQLLVVDVLNDTDQLKDPAELPDYPSALLEPSMAELSQPIAEAQKVAARLDPERCINPKRLKLKEIIKKAVARSLTRR